MSIRFYNWGYIILYLDKKTGIRFYGLWMKWTQCVGHTWPRFPLLPGLQLIILNKRVLGLSGCLCQFGFCVPQYLLGQYLFVFYFPIVSSIGKVLMATDFLEEGMGGIIVTFSCYSVARVLSL